MKAIFNTEGIEAAYENSLKKNDIKFNSEKRGRTVSGNRNTFFD